MTRLDLSGSWVLRPAAPLPELTESIPASIPGDNLTALHRARIVKDPYHAMNELDVQWIGRADWILERDVEVGPEIAQSPHVRFRADSVDTVAEIAINGTPIGSTDNMFVCVDLLVPAGLLRSGTNTITVTIASAERVAIERAASLPYPVPHSVNPVQSPHRNLVRKVQCHSGWDWGPCLMVCGMYGTVELAASDAPMLDRAPATAVKRNGTWVVVVEPRFSLPRTNGASYEGTVAVTVRDPAGTQVGARQVKCTVDGPQTGLIEVEVPEPELWWPNGYGGQPLYTVEVQAFEDRIERRIGFRTLEVRRQADEDGEELAFVVNDVPIFAKGANWIPLDAMPGRGTEDQLRLLLESSAEAHMNMLRVWGGGTYESDRFYELCDELGLLIWQDFMFSCALYPADETFLESVRNEVEHQVLRLKDHPCVALWCGNNENIGALNWYEESRRNRDRYLVDYDRLNEGAVGAMCRALDPTRIFWPSSPTDGPGEYSDDWKADQRGDMHYWSVWHGGEPFSSYRTVVPRFCSEFGFQSFPSLSGVQTYARPDHLNVTAPEMEHHQRNPRGNTIIMQTMARYYRFPNCFEEHLYLSQVQQAHAIRTAVEYWRARRPRCMGALYWQLNDTWPVASWASIEYGGKWKLLHYAAKRFFAPTLVAAVPVDEAGTPLATEDAPAAGWNVAVANDRNETIRGDLRVRIVGFDGSVLADVRQTGLAVPAGTSDWVYRISAQDLPTGRNRCCAVIDWYDAQRSESSPVRSQLFFDAPKRCEFEKARITATVIRQDGEIAVRLESALPAFDVAVDAGDAKGHFSDNMVTLLPGEPCTLVWLASQSGEAPQDFGQTLTVRALNDIGR